MIEFRIERDGETIEMTTHLDADLPQLEDVFQRFLLAAGYVFKGDVKIGYIEDVPMNRSNSITDGHGNWWSKACPECKQDTMQVIRPGKVQCSECG